MQQENVKQITSPDSAVGAKLFGSQDRGATTLGDHKTEEFEWTGRWLGRLVKSSEALE